MIIEDITFFTRLGYLLQDYEPVHMNSGPVLREDRGFAAGSMCLQVCMVSYGEECRRSQILLWIETFA